MFGKRPGKEELLTEDQFKEFEEATNKILPTEKQETLGEFESKIVKAQQLGYQWVETSYDVIKHYLPQGLGGSKYFTYKNINVCEFGKTDEILKDINVPLAVRMHGKEEGTIISGS